MNGMQSRHAAPLTVILLTLIVVGCSQIAPLAQGPGTAAFLDAGDFSGHYKSKSGQANLGGQSTYLGRMVFTNLDRLMVAGVLPPELRLAANNSSTPNQHPVLLLFGNQTNTAWVLPGGSPTIGSNYLEIVLLIPFVQKAGKSRWHNYVVRMYLNESIPTLIGNQFYGYQKKMSTFGTTATDFNVFLQAVHMFKAQTVTLGSWVPHSAATGTMNNYAQALEIMAMPVLGTLELVPAKPHVCSYFEWNMDEAHVRKISSDHSFMQSFVAPQMDPWVAKGNLSSVPEGAFELKNVEWRIQMPARVCKW